MSSKRPTADTFQKKRLVKHKRTKGPRTRPGGYQRRKQSGT